MKFLWLMLILASPALAQQPALATTKNEGEVTFAEHVGPIIHRRCAECHRKGQPAPFPLTTFAEVSKRAKLVNHVVRKGYMPPWPPEPGDVPFKDDRNLGREEVDLIARWLKSGKKKGDLTKLPTLAKFAEGWPLGKPDLVVKMAKPYTISADGPDVYRNFAIPLKLKKDRWLKAVSMRPKAPQVVHHVLYFLDETGQASALEAKQGGNGFRQMSFRIAKMIGGYVPGDSARRLPEDLAIFVPKGSDLVLQSHFHPTGKKEVEQMTLALYFTDQKPKSRISAIQVPPLFGFAAGIDVPAGEKNYQVEQSFELPVDVDAWIVSGHAHYICQKILLKAKTPKGQELTLLKIDDWDLDWQGDYHFEKKVALPQGTILTTNLTYDNSADNPNNPFSPPVRIRWGRESTDEMGSTTLLVTPKNPKDSGKLEASLRRLMLSSMAKRFRNRGNFFAQFAAGLFRRFDKNKDDILEKDEVPGRWRDRLFDGLDVDGDGTIKKTELEEVLEVPIDVTPKTAPEKKPAIKDTSTKKS